MEREIDAFTYRAGMLQNGAVKDLDLYEAIKQIGPNLIWIDLRVKDREATRKILAEQFQFHPLAIEDALSKEERPSLHDYPDGIFLEVGIMSCLTSSCEFDDVGVFVKENLVVTVSTLGTTLLSSWYQRWVQRPVETAHTSQLILYGLLDMVVDGYFPVIDDLQDKVEELEESIYAGKTLDIKDALAIKRQLLNLRRRLTPQRDILNGLLRRDLGLIGRDVVPYFQDVYDHSLRVIENLDLSRDILTTIMDAQLSVASNRLNEVMRTMTVIATILMSMALIAGIYGMNFHEMPELDWKYGYAFAWFLMILVGAVELWIFNKKKWL